MAEEKQKYSLISLDTGEEPIEATVLEKRAGVTTTTQVVDGEETIRVSSAVEAPTPADEFVDAAVSAEDLPGAAGAQVSDTRKSEEPVQEEAPAHASDAPEDEEPVPYRRMQSAIILCLVVLIVAFIVYFNFFR